MQNRGLLEIYLFARLGLIQEMTARNRRQIDRNCGAVLFGFHKHTEKYVTSFILRGRISVRVSLRRKAPFK